MPVCNPAVSGLANCDPSKAPVMFGSVLSSIFGFLLFIAGIWAFIRLLIAGISWISSGGDKSKIEMDRDRILHALVGLLIVAASWAVYLFILNFLGLTSGIGLNFRIPTLLGN